MISKVAIACILVLIPLVVDANIDDRCLACICNVESGCRPLACRWDVNSNSCGYFQLKSVYWRDCGSPGRSFEACAADKCRNSIIDASPASWVWCPGTFVERRDENVAFRVISNRIRVTLSVCSMLSKREETILQCELISLALICTGLRTTWLKVRKSCGRPCRSAY